MTLVRQKGSIVGVSSVFDYVYRPLELEYMSLYEWVHRCSQIKLPKVEQMKGSKKDNPEPDISFDSVSDGPLDSHAPDARCSRSIHEFLPDHSLHTTHSMQLHKADPKKIPNFIGATLPRKDQDDRNYYCLTMLALFKPWRK